jgi:hypothetical protein
MEKRSYSIARVLVFFFSVAVAYALWTYLRPRFVSPAAPETSNLIEQETKTAQPKTLSTDSTAETSVQTDVSAPAAAQPPVTITEKDPKAPLGSSIKSPSTAKEEPSALATVDQSATKAPAHVAKPTKALSANRTITVHNGIERKMLGYKKFGTHYPTNFKLFVGKNVIEQGSQSATTISNNTLVVNYHFDFMNGYRTGAKEVIFTLKPDVENLTLAFNWKGEHRLYAEDDKIVSIVEKDIPYQA